MSFDHRADRGQRGAAPTGYRLSIVETTPSASCDELRALSSVTLI